MRPDTVMSSGPAMNDADVGILVPDSQNAAAGFFH